MTQPTSLVVHHLNDSRSQRILWLLEELEVPYELKKYERGPDRRAPPELKAIHPLGKSPLITDGPVTLAESGAIVEYIISKYGRPADRPSPEGELDNPTVRSHPSLSSFLRSTAGAGKGTHYAEGTLMPLIASKIIYTIFPTKVPFFLRPLASFLLGTLARLAVDPELAANSSLIEGFLADNAGSVWFAHGERPTAADYMMLFPLEALCTGHGGDVAALVGERMRRWVDTVHARPAYQRALEKGGEYAFYG